VNIVNVRDITLRLNMEKELERSELRYRTVVEDQTDLIERLLPDGTYVFVNGTYRRYFGDIENDGGNIFNHMRPEEQEQLKRSMAFLTPANKIRIDEGPVITQYGETRWVQWAYRGIFDDKGGLVEVQCVGRDITEIRKAQQALMESEQKYRELVESSNAIIFKMDADGRVLSFNEYAEKFFGFSRDEIIGRSVYETIVPRVESTGRDLGNLVNDIFAHEREFANNLNENVKKDGGRAWIQWTNKPIRDSGGKLACILCVGTDVTRQKSMQEELNRNEARFRAAFDKAAIGMLSASLEGEIMQANDAFCRMLGYPEEEMIGKNILDFTYPDDIPFTRKVLSDLVSGKSDVMHYEKRYLRKDKEILWGSLSVSSVRDADDKPVYELAQIQDITKRKEAEDALQLQTKILKAMNEILEETVSSESEEHLCMKCLEVVCDLTGSQLGFMDEIIGDSHAKNMAATKAAWDECQTPPDSARKFLSTLSAMVEKDIVISKKSLMVNDFENSPYRFSTPDGYPPIRSFLGIPVTMSEKIIAVIAMANKDNGDYTEKDIQVAEMLSVPIAEAINRFRIKEALSEQRALQESEERFRGIAERSFDAIITADNDGKITYASPSIGSVLGVRPEEITGRSLSDLGFIPITETPEQAIARLHRGESTIGDLIKIKKNGISEAFIEINASPIFRRGEVVGSQAVLRDVTERQRLQAMKDQFISAITHELRTPLLSIVGYLEYIKSGKDGPVPDDINSHLEIIKRNSLRLKSLTDDLLDLSRIDAGRLELNLETLDFREVLDQCVAEAGQILSPKAHAIRVKAPDGLLQIKGDRMRLAQIMMNLLSNSIKYSPEGGDITVNVSLEDRILMVSITDIGIGIRNEDLKRVFERFATIQKSVYAKGTGLGLSVTKELVEAHGGRIWAESEGEGKGSTFTFVLPLDR
jgi:PAS domain S-box-containing protein